MPLIGGSSSGPTDKLKKAERGAAQAKNIMGQIEQLTREMNERAVKLERLKKQLAQIQSQMK